MKKICYQKIIYFTLASSLVAISCSTAQKKVIAPAPQPVTEVIPKEIPEPVLKTRAVDPTEVIASANERLAEVPMLALPAFKSSYKKIKFTRAADKTLAVAKSVLESLPEGYILQITGYSNPYPPRSKSKSTRLSSRRAKFVYDYFVQNGLEKEKLSYRGVGATEYDETLSHDSNRRVTFKVVKTQQPD